MTAVAIAKLLPGVASRAFLGDVASAVDVVDAIELVAGRRAIRLKPLTMTGVEAAASLIDCPDR